MQVKKLLAYWKNTWKCRCTMKKKMFYLLVTLMITINVYAASAKFKFDGSEIFKGKSKSQNLALEFEQSYNINSNEKEQEQEALKDLAKQATYYLLGPANNINETSESYIKRKNDFYSLRYAPEIPLNADGTLNSNTQEYTDELFTGIVIPNMFVIVNDLEIIYEQYNDVNIVSVKDVQNKFKDSIDKYLDKIKKNMKFYF